MQEQVNEECAPKPTMRNIKNAMVRAYKDYYTEEGRPDVAILTKRFRKTGIERRLGSYTNDPRLEADVWSESLANKVGAPARQAGSHRVTVTKYSDDAYGVTATTYDRPKPR